MTESTISYGKGSSKKTVELGTISSITDTINTKTFITQTPMMPAEMQFGMDTGATESLQIKTTHIHGDNMTNASWIKAMEDAVNRWQAQTDGCKFRYIPNTGVTDYIASYQDVNSYIQSFSYTYSAGNPEVLDGSLTLSVGSIMGGKDISGSNPLSTFRV